MHVIEIIRENPLGIANGTYLAEDINAGEMLSRGWCKVQEPGPLSITGTIPRHLADFRVLFVRPGGLGDLLFLTPTFAEIKRRWPQCEIYVACFERYRSALLNNPDVDGFIDYPIPVSKWVEFDAQVWLENIIEDNPEAQHTHAVDLIANRVGIELADKRMSYFVTGEERALAEMEFPRGFQARIGVQMGSNQGNMLRMYGKMNEVSKRLWLSGHEVFLFGSPGDFKCNEPEGIVNLMQKGKTFRQSCAILQTCDVIVAPDSALTHVAGALGIPCVALYGPFPWKLRTLYAEKTFALQGSCPVSPCFHHVRPGTGHFPEFGPCAQTFKCEAMAMITPERVIREVEKMLTNRKELVA